MNPNVLSRGGGFAAPQYAGKASQSLRPQPQIKPNKVFPGACTSGKTPLAKRSAEPSALADGRGAQRSAIPYREEGCAFFAKLRGGGFAAPFLEALP